MTGDVIYFIGFFLTLPYSVPPCAFWRRRCGLSSPPFPQMPLQCLVTVRCNDFVSMFFLKNKEPFAPLNFHFKKNTGISKNKVWKHTEQCSNMYLPSTNPPLLSSTAWPSAWTKSGGVLHPETTHSNDHAHVDEYVYIYIFTSQVHRNIIYHPYPYKLMQVSSHFFHRTIFRILHKH